MRLTDEQIDILWQEFGPDAGWRSEDGIPLSHAVLLSLLAEVRASRAARAESEGTRECVFGDPIPPDDLPPRESIHDAASSESEGTRLDGTLYERCPLCLARTAQATRLAHEAAPASRDGQGETP